MEVARNEGWSLDFVENWLTFDRLRLLRKHWRRHPPLHLLVAKFVGYEEPVETEGVDYEAELAKHAAWFENPERFFSGLG